MADLELAFGFGVSGEENRLETDVGVLEPLEPCQNLLRLSIYSYTGLTVSPTWMISLTKFKHLELVFSYNCETLPSLGKLPSLESLQIYRFPSVKKVGLEFWE